MSMNRKEYTCFTELFILAEYVYKDNGNNVDNENALTFEDNYPCSYEGCKDGNFFLKILKYKKIRSPPN